MHEHKFTYTVAGVQLTEDQKTRVSQAIATAVAGVLADEAPGPMTADSLTLGRIYGGIWVMPQALRQAEGSDPVVESVRALAAG